MSSAQDKQKQAVARAALDYIEYGTLLGVGSGSTVNYFIDALATIKPKIEAAIASSKTTLARLQAIGIPVLDLNSVSEVPLYIDGADEVNPAKQMIKGGGGALTSEKIIAAVAKKFICIVDQSKLCDLLGNFPIAVEVIPMARSYVAREIVKLGGSPVYRQGFVTDHHHVILDVHHLKILNPTAVETTLNHITGVVTNGIFAKRAADQVLVATPQGINQIS